MYEYKCKKCSKEVEYHLKIQYHCDCGGEFKRIDKPYKYSDMIADRYKIKQSEEFIPVRRSGGFGNLWYYRRKKAKKTLKKI